MDCEELTKLANGTQGRIATLFAYWRVSERLFADPVSSVLQSASSPCIVPPTGISSSASYLAQIRLLRSTGHHDSAG